MEIDSLHFACIVELRLNDVTQLTYFPQTKLQPTTFISLEGSIGAMSRPLISAVNSIMSGIFVRKATRACALKCGNHYISVNLLDFKVFAHIERNKTINSILHLLARFELTTVCGRTPVDGAERNQM